MTITETNQRIVDFYIKQEHLKEEDYLPMFYDSVNGQKVLSIGLNPSMPRDIEDFLDKNNLTVKIFKNLSKLEQKKKIDTIIAYQRTLKYGSEEKKKMQYFNELEKFFKDLEYNGFNDFKQNVYHYDFYQKRNTASREVKVELRNQELVSELIDHAKMIVDEVKPKIIFVFNAFVADLLKNNESFLNEDQIDDKLGCHLFNNIPVVLANQLSGAATSIVYRDILIWNSKRILNTKKIINYNKK